MYLQDNSLLISAPKSSVTLLTLDTHQAHIHPSIFIENSHPPLVKCPRILGVYLDPSLSFNKHSQYVAERVSGRNKILKALAGTSWGQQKETLLMTYKAVGRSIINYATPVWSPNLHDINYRKIQYTHNEALRIATGCHKISSIDHLHTEAEILKVKEHSKLLSAQYLARCLEPGNVCHPITTRATPERQMKETLYTRHRNTVEPMMVNTDRKATLQAFHTAAVVNSQRSRHIYCFSCRGQLKITNRHVTFKPVVIWTCIRHHLKQNKITLITIIDNTTTTQKIHIQIQFIIRIKKYIYRKKWKYFFHQEEFFLIIT